MPKRTVADFLATKPERGMKCVSCQHARIKQVDKDCREFNEARRAGTTTHTWTAFVRHHVKPVHGYDHVVETLLRHLENCRGLEVQ